MITCDFHTHTSFSTDSESAPEVMAEAAVQKGLKTICFTDHLDLDYPFCEELGENAFQMDVDSYFDKMQQLKEKYQGQIDIRIGIELGMQPHLGEAYRKLTEKYPFDFVIGSVHLVRGTDPYYGEIFKEWSDADAYNETFLETIQDLKGMDAFDVCGHIDYVVRYGKYQAEQYSYQRFSDVLDEILRVVIEKGRGIEINTAGLKYGLGFCHPHPEILRRYRELGGEMITIGSDAHKPEHVAYEFTKAEEILKAQGFRYYTEFKERKPVFKPLD